MITKIKLLMKPGKEIPVVDQHVWANFTDGTYREFIILSIEDVRWTNRLYLEVTYKVRVVESKGKLEIRNGLKIVR